MYMKSKELILGLFMIGAIAILLFAVFSVRDFRFFNPTYTVKVKFNYGDGIKPASPVRLAGTEVGDVANVSLVDEQGKIKVVIDARIRKGIKIPQGSEAFVNSLGILGEKYLEIIPKENSQGFLKNESMLIGNDSYPIYKISSSIHSSLVRFNSILSSIERIVKDDEIGVTFKKLIGNIEQASSSLENILNDLQDERGSVGRLIYEDTLYIELEEMIKDLRNHPWKLLYKPKN